MKKLCIILLVCFLTHNTETYSYYPHSTRLGKSSRIQWKINKKIVQRKYRSQRKYRK